jgi:phosphomannomutase
MVAKRGKPLSALVQELFDEYGEHHTYREDVRTTNEAKQSVLDRLAKGGLGEIAGMTVERVDDLDGYKHIGAFDESGESGWLLVRPSGTEPVLRVYSEAPTQQQAVALVQNARRQLGVA